MRRLWTTWWFRWIARVLVFICTMVVLICWRWQIWRYHDYRVYREVCEYPGGSDLWFGRIHSGQDLEEFTAMHAPHDVHQLGHFTRMKYYTVWPTPPGALQMESLSVIAKDGRLVYAGAAGCTWHRVFFEMSANDREEFDRAWDQHIEMVLRRVAERRSK